jgi:hypothetical protein
VGQIDHDPAFFQALPELIEVVDVVGQPCSFLKYGLGFVRIIPESGFGDGGFNLLQPDFLGS